jgi:hypothetical protein
VKPKVYLETTILGYLTPMRTDPANLEQTLRRQHAEEWWSTATDKFDVFISEIVVTEAGLGRSDLAARRLDLINHLPFLPVAEEAVVRRFGVPMPVLCSPVDLLHLPS